MEEDFLDPNSDRNQQLENPTILEAVWKKIIRFWGSIKNSELWGISTHPISDNNNWKVPYPFYHAYIEKKTMDKIVCSGFHD